MSERGRLVISRKPGEVVLIGDDIEITILNFQNGEIKLLIKAPRDIKIIREEILTRPRTNTSSKE